MLQSKWIAVLGACLAFVLFAVGAHALPSGITIIPLGNQTSTPAEAGLINTSGGTITTLNLNGTTQNVRWKAFVGNVTGQLVLDDASAATIYSWEITRITGEVYVTRHTQTINWTGLSCANATHIRNEDLAMNHTNRDDNVTKTFSQQTHRAFYVGTKEIAQDSCFSLHTYVNDSAQSNSFEEMVTYDGTNLTDGRIVYVSSLEQDIYGYNNRTYDFQMIVPEKGLAGWDSSTAYYFYMELT